VSGDVGFGRVPLECSITDAYRRLDRGDVLGRAVVVA
jgi:hypothetical protein